MEIRIGTSGWSYAHWDQTIYGGIAQAKRLAFYSTLFNTVEVNTTFYHLPLIPTVKNWREQVPEVFLFSVKASRYITHIQRLKGCSRSLQKFYTRIIPLKTKLGPILFQLPPSFEKDLVRLKSFIRLLKPGYSYVFEFRADSWFDEEVYDVLQKKNIALCISDLNGKLTPLKTTADFVYLRLHGPAHSYRGIYGKKRLLVWAKRIKRWARKKDVYVYFDNDEKGYAVKDASVLKKFFSPF